MIVLGGSDAYVNEVAKVLNLTNEDVRWLTTALATTHGRINNEGPSHYGTNKEAGSNRAGAGSEGAFLTRLLLIVW